MKIAIGSDRRGYEYKKALIEYLSEKGYEICDVGPHCNKYPVDYPIYGECVGQLVSSHKCDKGIVICATGIGIMIACGKIKGIRCGMGYSEDVARLMREHNDANVIAFGQDYMDLEDVKHRVDIFLNTDFVGGYHCTRVQQIRDIEEGKSIKQTPFIDKI